MNKRIFILLVALMSLSLIGIIFVQGYWINTAVENKEEEFKLNVTQILSSVSDKIQDQEKKGYVFKFQKLMQNSGQLDHTEVSEMMVYQKHDKTDDMFLFRSGVVEQNYNFSPKTIFEDTSVEDTISLSRYYSKSSTTFFDDFGIDSQSKISLQEQIQRYNELPSYNQDQLDEIYVKLASKTPIQIGRASCRERVYAPV